MGGEAVRFICARQVEHAPEDPPSPLSPTKTVCTLVAATRAGPEIRNARNAADEHRTPHAFQWVPKVNILRYEIGTIGRQSQTSQTRIGRRSAGRLDGTQEWILLQVENVHVIDVRKIAPLARLIVDEEFLRETPKLKGTGIRGFSAPILRSDGQRIAIDTGRITLITWLEETDCGKTRERPNLVGALSRRD